MSQVVTRSGIDPKEKKSTESPSKELKKKSGESEKEKGDKKEKVAEKAKDKATEKAKDKATEKSKDAAKPETSSKADAKPDKETDKQKQTSKTDPKPSSKPEKSDPKHNGKSEKTEAKQDTTSEKSDAKQNGSSEKSDSKQNGNANVQNGVSESKEGLNGTLAVNGTSVSPDIDDDDVLMTIDDNDELFPELKYDEASDPEYFERDTPDNVPSRSLTRRSQVKNTRTPETPCPVTESVEKDKNGEESNKQESNSSIATDTKLLKLRTDPVSSRRLRSADNKTPDPDKEEKDDDGNVLERARETAFSKSRVKVSPYRARFDASARSVCANYSGNNTTMEMDITESSMLSSEAGPDTSYIGARVRGRQSYKQLKPIDFAKFKKARENQSFNSSSATVASAQPSPAAAAPRPCGAVVGRKREATRAEGAGAGSGEGAEETEGGAAKRPRGAGVLGRVTRSLLTSTPLLARRAAPIVGINSDLPLSAPVAPTDTFDPETLGVSSPPLQVDADSKHDSKRCTIM